MVRSLWMMLPIVAVAKTQYRDIGQVTREKYRNASWYFDAFGLPEIVARKPNGLSIAFIGDSVSRNQMQFLCDVLGSPPVEVRHGLVCRGRGVFCALRVFDGGNDPWHMSSAGEVLKSLARNIPTGPGRFDAVYFGSTALHMLQLLPAVRWRAWSVARSLEVDLASALEAIPRCPVFTTANWLCSNKFFLRPELPFGKILNKAARNTSYFKSECAAATESKAEAALCRDLTFTTGGSERANALERAAVKAAGPLRVVDSYAMTRDQCWATSDGIHYMPLLPYRVASLLAHVRDCLDDDS